MLKLATSYFFVVILEQSIIIPNSTKRQCNQKNTTANEYLQLYGKTQ